MGSFSEIAEALRTFHGWFIRTLQAVVGRVTRVRPDGEPSPDARVRRGLGPRRPRRSGVMLVVGAAIVCACSVTRFG